MRYCIVGPWPSCRSQTAVFRAVGRTHEELVRLVDLFVIKVFEIGRDANLTRPESKSLWTQHDHFLFLSVVFLFRTTMRPYSDDTNITCLRTMASYVEGGVLLAPLAYKDVSVLNLAFVTTKCPCLHINGRVIPSVACARDRSPSSNAIGSMSRGDFADTNAFHVQCEAQRYTDTRHPLPRK